MGNLELGAQALVEEFDPVDVLNRKRSEWFDRQAGEVKEKVGKVEATDRGKLDTDALQSCFSHHAIPNMRHA